MRFRSTPGLAAWSALNLMPVLRQMAMAVSPATTMCLRGAAARVTGSIWRRAGGGAGAVGGGGGGAGRWRHGIWLQGGRWGRLLRGIPGIPLPDQIGEVIHLRLQLPVLLQEGFELLLRG